MSENPIEFAPRCTERGDGGVTVVELSGEIDLRTAPPLIALLDALTAGPRPDLVLDLRPVTFLDCSGLRLLCRARNRAVERHGRLRLITESRRFRRIIQHARLTGVFEVHDRLPEIPVPAADSAPAASDAAPAASGAGPVRSVLSGTVG
ncbi:STAS domain-containing protein [Streptomyces spirodelae]|uniref:Anti-sigma factor antagonist n=1 Tax=Streptomyces spirodelae TaxID=2812904 RepID=A0ABS3WX51_9ACTN|nr:STAS domain-containing protein [Streptomyces spirodelae]MBO8187710.1 STAS domain-containing protein [Streptomyces spirodelae]